MSVPEEIQKTTEVSLGRTSDANITEVTVVFRPLSVIHFPFFVSTAQFRPWLPLQLLDVGQSVGLLGRVISSSQGLYLYTNTEKRTHNTNTKQSCPEWDSNTRSRRPRERRQFMP
jgi:hypothetical protein